MIRVKRLFGRVKPTREGTVLVADTVDVARDLEWLCERYPLRMSESSREFLTARANEFRAKEEKVAAIVGGATLHTDLVEPARTPRWYQTQVADMVLTTGALLNTDPLGAGKTMSALLALRSPDALPAAVVTLNGKLPQQWCDEVAKTLPWLKTHVLRVGHPYDEKVPQKHHDALAEADVVVLPYSKLSGWADVLAGQVRTIIFDEAQELRHAGTDKYVAAGQIADQCAYRIGLSNTPVYNYGIEAHAVLDVIAPGALGTREEFTREWCTANNSGHVVVKDPDALRAYLRDLGIVLGRTEDELGIELPPPQRLVRHVNADPAVLEKLQGNAVEMAKLLLDSSATSWERRNAAGDLDWQMRQATGIAKAPFVAEYVRLLLEADLPVLLMGWHRAVYDIWRERLREWKPVLYTGTESVTQKRRTFEAFTRGDSRVLVMSLRSGAGIDGLQAHCSDVVFGELDWSPKVHSQVVGRLRRSGMDVSKPVRAHFLVAGEGSDPTIAQVHGVKNAQGRIFEVGAPVSDEAFKAAAAAESRMKMLAADLLARSGVQLEQREEAS